MLSSVNGCPGLPFTEPGFQDILEDCRVVFTGVGEGIEKDDVFSPVRPDLFQNLPFSGKELPSVAVGKLSETVGMGMEKMSQFLSGRPILGPEVDGSDLSGNAPGPETVDKDANGPRIPGFVPVNPPYFNGSRNAHETDPFSGLVASTGLFLG